MRAEYQQADKADDEERNCDELRFLHALWAEHPDGQDEQSQPDDTDEPFLEHLIACRGRHTAATGVHVWETGLETLLSYTRNEEGLFCLRASHLAPCRELRVSLGHKLKQVGLGD